jgi:hypothetical protein
LSEGENDFAVRPGLESLSPRGSNAALGELLDGVTSAPTEPHDLNTMSDWRRYRLGEYTHETANDFRHRLDKIKERAACILESLTSTTEIQVMEMPTSSNNNHNMSITGESTLKNPVCNESLWLKIIRDFQIRSADNNEQTSLYPVQQQDTRSRPRARVSRRDYNPS